jgi:cell volume regulation protein A
MSIFLMLVARPAAVFLALALARLRFRQKAMIAWVGLRGAVPIVLATFPYQAGLPRADLYFNIVFFIVLTSVLLQGTSLRRVAGWLRLERPLAPSRQYPWEFVSGKTGSDIVKLKVLGSSPVAGKRVMDLGLPDSTLIVLVGRGDHFIVPRGSTVLEGGDDLMILADNQQLPVLRSTIESHRQNEV